MLCKQLPSSQIRQSDRLLLRTAIRNLPIYIVPFYLYLSLNISFNFSGPSQGFSSAAAVKGPVPYGVNNEPSAPAPKPRVVTTASIKPSVYQPAQGKKKI